MCFCVNLTAGWGCETLMPNHPPYIHSLYLEKLAASECKPVSSDVSSKMYLAKQISIIKAYFVWVRVAIARMDDNTLFFVENSVYWTGNCNASAEDYLCLMQSLPVVVILHCRDKEPVLLWRHDSLLLSLCKSKVKLQHLWLFQLHPVYVGGLIELFTF